MKKLGVFLLIFSFLPWVAIVFLIPFLPLTIAQKAVLIPLLIGVAELSFWLGVLIVGKEAATKYRHYLTPRTLWKNFKKLFR